jgi:hypothetical protein
MNRQPAPDHLRGVGTDAVFLTATWQHLAMLNYEVDASLLQPFVPPGTELDRWENKIFISLIGFRFLKTKLLGFLSVPFHANFDEVNLRFYVRRQTAGEIRRGVVFIREIVPRRGIAFAAQTFYNENYVAVPMTHEICPIGDNLSVAYRWRAQKHWNGISLETAGEAAVPREGSVGQFITEHYWGYSSQRNGGCVEYRVTHPSWRVWQVKRSHFSGDASALFGEEFSAALRGEPDSAFLAEGSPVAVMRGRKLKL